MESRSRQLREIFSIDDNHCLELESARERIAPGGERLSAMYTETDGTDSLVARYRIWIDKPSKPPYRMRRGWEKYTPEGELADREIRYSKSQPTSVELPATVQLDEPLL